MQLPLKLYVSFLAGVVFLSFSFLLPAVVYAGGVCSQGTGIPPFFESGADPNLLLLLDNSGSMLDMAYTDEQTYIDTDFEFQNICFDESYLLDDFGTTDVTKTYVGNFEPDKWYKWVDAAALPVGIDQWTTRKCYGNDDLVINGSILYEAICGIPSCNVEEGSTGPFDGCMSDGNNVGEDNENGGVIWRTSIDYEPWRNTTSYSENDFVKYQDNLYRAGTTGTSAGTSPIDDTGVSWEFAEHTWLPNKGYIEGNIVTYKGMLFIAKQDLTSSSTGLFDDRVGGPAGLLQWDRIDEGYFQELPDYSSYDLFSSLPSAADLCTGYSYAHTFTDESGNEVTDLAITMVDSSESYITDVTTQLPANVTCFAASGNFLNWASASKFDIEKKILTGGKYYAGYENQNADGTIDKSIATDSDDDRVISESRGCAGLGFTKQVTFTQSSSGGPLGVDADINLTLRIRGSDDEDWIDSTDKVTRIEILAVTENGYDGGACQAVVNAIIEGASFNSISNLISLCLENSSNDERAALNHGLQYCEALRSKTADRDLNTIVEDCKTIYSPSTGNISPATIQPEQGSYMCAGVFDNTILHTDRKGYMGRCWSLPSAETCWQKSCSTDCTSPPCYDKSPAGDSLMCAADGFEYVCGGQFNSVQNTCNKPWEAVYEGCPDPATCTSYDPCTPSGSTVAGWSDDIDGIPGPPDDPDGLVAAICHDGSEGVNCECIGQAMYDYCQDMSVPEVIDPSDVVSSTIEYLGLPGSLVDSGVMSQLNVKNPLATYKSYIKYEPDTTDSVEKPDSPKGVIYDVATKVRLGVMAFVDNGSSTECDQLKICSVTDGAFDVCLTDPTSEDCAYCESHRSIEKFCPQTNADGARVLVPVSRGMTVDANNSENWDHYNNLVASINDSRATSWTPLGEAMFTAAGYFTQNADFCLDNDDEGCLNFPIDNDPIQYWCQDNHILIITEGASTADINADVADFVSNPSKYFVDKHDEDIITGDGDTIDGACTDGLDGSTYLDDMTWWGRHIAPFYAQRTIKDEDGNENDKQKISTHIVTTGALDSEGDGECSAETLMWEAAENGGISLYTGADPAQLETNLRTALSDILSRASAGSAASVISSSRSGSGAVYQAIFWPKLSDAEDNTVEWVGDVHALFISADGFMYEDTDGDGKLNPSGDLNNNSVIDNDEVTGGGDKQVIFFYSENSKKTRGCYNITDFITNDFHCPDDPEATLCGVEEDCVEIQNVKYLWSASKKLRDMLPGARNIYTWNDFNNDGIVTTTSTPSEWFSFDKDTPWTLMNTRAAEADVNSGAGPRGSVTEDFLQSEDWSSFVDNDTSDMELDAMQALVGWIRGEDQLNDEISDITDGGNSNGRLDKKLRSRQFHLDIETKEWRLGDIIHSTPIVVARPAEAYHYIYRDPSYARFAKKYANRRNMIYFGSNDGMLHAVNGAFYSENAGQFCCEEFDNDQCGSPLTAGSCKEGIPDPGEEMWAYIPYNLQPHLKCLADPDYVHKYYVDHNPRIYDVQIFDNDNDHIDGWGTILVGSMGLGGAPVNASDLNGLDNDNREFTSSFFILDITNPEVDPILLGEMTRTTEGNDEKYVDLHYTTSSTSMVVMRRDDGTTDWYLAMGNGPSGLDGTNDNDNQGKLAILPLDWLTGAQGGAGAVREFRIPNVRPDGSSVGSGEGGVFLVPRTSAGEPSFISDMITVDFDVENIGSVEHGALYRSDAVYFGTTDGTGFANYAAPEDDKTYWNGGGRLFRLVTKSDITVESWSQPSEWKIPWFSDDNDADNPVRMLIDTKAPITAAPAVGYDGESFWVYAGTGRFYDKKDKTDDGQPDILGIRKSKISYFGIREPYTRTDCKDTSPRVLTWGTNLWDINSNDSSGLSHNGTPGERGLMQVDNIIVAEGSSSEYKVRSTGLNASYLECAHCIDNDDGPSCSSILPDGLDCPLDTLISDSFTTEVYDNDSTTGEMVLFENLRDYIAGTGCVDNDQFSTGIDGWYRDFHEPRERNLGQAALLGGLLTFTGYQPYNDICKAEGESFLYGVQYQTGVAWTESVFGLFDYGSGSGSRYVKDKLSLGRGLATTPSMHVGQGDKGPAKAFIQTTTGEIIEIVQESLPFENVKSRRTGWTDRCE